jgi:hypothetical protein
MELAEKAEEVPEPSLVLFCPILLTNGPGELDDRPKFPLLGC